MKLLYFLLLMILDTTWAITDSLAMGNEYRYVNKQIPAFNKFSTCASALLLPFLLPV